MITISLCMIVKNEEDVIARCLDSVKNIVDEIIIVDTGSTDSTKEICQSYTDKIYDFRWIDDFSAARNYSYSKATKDYILWLDADDVILSKEKIKFKKLKQALDTSVDIVMMKYNVGFDERGNTTLSYFRERLSKRNKDYKWHEPIHEYLETNGNIVNSDIAITHKKERATAQDRNLLIYRKLLHKGVNLSPRGVYYFARELYYNERYEDAIRLFIKFLDTKKGWIEDNISACYLLSICYNAISDKENMLNSLLKSFEYDTPRAEICCHLGYYFFENGDYEKAIFWYKLATQLKKSDNTWGFVLHDYWGYIPNIQLCVCYDKLGKTKEAIKYNNRAAKYKPNDPSVIYNSNYFESLTKSI